MTPVAAAGTKSSTRAASTPGYAYTGINPCRAEDTRTDGKTLGAGGTVDVVVAGGSCTAVPSTATAVVVTATVTDTTAPSYVTVYPTGGTNPGTSNQNWSAAGATIASQVTALVGTGGSITAYNFAGSADVIIDIDGYYSATGANSFGHYVPLGTPVRIADTRNTFQTIAPNSSQDFYISGALTTSGSGVQAAVLNVTVTNTQAPGFLTISPKGSTAATTSMLNWGTGQTIANRHYAELGTGGYITVFNGSAGSTDVVIDGSGYFADATAGATTGSLFQPLSAPARVTDSRSAGTTLGTNSVASVTVGGNAGIPTNATAVVQNLTVTNTTGSSYLTAYPNSRPLASDVNWLPGWTIANAATTTLNSGGAENLYNLNGSVDFVVDAFGYFTPAPGVIVTADPSSIAANGTSQSTITVNVSNSSGQPIANDMLNFTTSGSPSGACGTLAAGTNQTNSSGQYQTKYTSSTTAGTCTITVTEATGGKTGSTTVTQTANPNSVAVNFCPSGATTCTTTTQSVVPGDGSSQLAVSAQVTNTTTSGTTNKSGVSVTFALTPNPSGACGTLSASSGTTNSNGEAIVTYTASSTSGFCKVTATEAQTSQSGSNTITQSSNPTPTTAIAGGAYPTNGPADGKTTTTLSAQVCSGAGVPTVSTTSASGSCAPTTTAVANDLVSFTINTAASTAKACGTLSSQFATTNASGTAQVTYTPTTTAGNCVFNATEAAGGKVSTNFTYTQNPVPNTVSVTASPSTIPADGSSTSAITVKITDVTGAAVANEPVSVAGSGVCATTQLNPQSGKTDSTGTFTSTYTSNTTVGFCKITATDTGTAGGSGSTQITQTTGSAPTVKMTANPTSVPATGDCQAAPCNVSYPTAPYSTITTTVTNSSGGNVNGDLLSYSLTPSTSGACGYLSTTKAPATGGGAAASTTGTTTSGTDTKYYHPSTTVGTCTISVIEANAGQTASTAVTQTAVPYAISVSPTSKTLPADGASQQQFIVTVSNAVTGAAISGDTVTVTSSPSTAGSCGTTDSTSGATNSSGQYKPTYTASTTAGFCQLTFTESATGSSAKATVDQTTNPAPAVGVVKVTSANSSGTATATVPANGSSTLTIYATVCTNGGTFSATTPATCQTGSPIANDQVYFSLSGSACGTLSSPYASTNSAGQASVTYTASKTAGSCTLNAQDANTGGTSGGYTITNSPVPNTVTASFSPNPIRGNGVDQSTLTVTVTSASGTPVNGDTVTLTVPAAAPNTNVDCGTFTGTAPYTALTNASGVATFTYTAAATPGFCTVTATENGTGTPASGTSNSANATITQTVG